MRIGIVGAGIMGRAMAERLLAKGHSVVVWNRTYETAKGVLAAGAGWVESPAEAARRSQVVISMVTDPAAVESVAMARDGIASGLPEDSVHVDMSTVSPATATNMAAAYEGLGKRFLQAPVLGSKKQISAGELLIFAGGADENIVLCEGAFRSLASQVWCFDTASQAASTKLACNMLLAHTIVGLGQSLLFAEKSGVDPSTFIEILGRSAMASPMIASKGKTLVERDFTPNFFVRHMAKDLALADETTQSIDLVLIPNNLMLSLYRLAMDRGWGDEDYSAVIKALENSPIEP